MFRLSPKSLLIGAVVAATLAVGASQADAFWGWRRCRSACWGYYTPYYAVSYSPCCYTGCGGWYVGCRHHCYYSGCYSWSSCCWDACSWDVCCANVTMSAAQPAAPTRAEKPTPAPAEKPATGAPAAEPALEPAAVPAEPPAILPGLEPEPALTPEQPAANPSSRAVPTRENSGLLTIYVPYDAKVTINGLPTHSKGSRRQYVSYGLKPGFSYRYEVRAEVVRDGRVIEEGHTAVLNAGDRKALAFGFNAELTEGLASR